MLGSFVSCDWLVYLPVDGVGEATQDALSHSDSPLFASVCVGELTIALAAATQ